MKKQLIIGIIISAIFMLILPSLIFAFWIENETVFNIMMILLFFGYPAYQIIIGIWAGIYSKYLWSLPIISATFFQITLWFISGDQRSHSVIFTLVYLAFGVLSMAIFTVISSIFRSYIRKS